MTKKVVFGLVGLLWLLALLQMSGSAKNQDENKVISAFSRVDYSESRCTLEISSSAGSGYYLAGEREELLKSFAADLGITMGYELSEVRDGGRLETSLKKDGKNGSTTLRFVSVEDREGEHDVEVENYFYAKLTIYQNLDSALPYKKLMEDLLSEYRLAGRVTLELTGICDSRLDLAAKDVITDEMMKKMGAKVQEGHRTDELYTVYGYTENVKDYVLINGRRVNINIAFSYDELTGRTFIYLGCPILLNDY